MGEDVLFEAVLWSTIGQLIGARTILFVVRHLNWRDDPRRHNSPPDL